MRKVGKMLPSAMANEELLRISRAQAVLRRWPEVVGEMLAERSHPDRYGKGTVWVAVEGSAWAQELRMMKERILARLHELSGEPALFSDVRFGVRPLPKKSEEPPAEETPVEKTAEELSIREIAERRLARWKDEGRD